MSAEVKPGYKQTEIGVIPEDWRVERVGDIATVSSGGTPSRVNPNYWGGDIPWITTTQVDFNVIREAQQYITRDGMENSAAKMLPPGTLLLALYGQGKTRGKVAMLGVAAATNQACASISISDPVLAQFTFNYLTSQYETIRASSNGGSQDNLSGGIVKHLQIPVPPRMEQPKITSVLSDIDALINGLDQLITKKRDIQQAAMQQLITGQRRLPGFSGEWEVRKLGDIGFFMKGSGITRDQSNSGHLPCVRYGELYTAHHDIIREFQSFISKVVAVNSTSLKKGDLLFAGSGETKAEIGKCAAFVHDIEAYAGGDIVILRPVNVDSTFLGYALNTQDICRQKASRGQGDAVVHISANALSTVEIRLPAKEEQTAIAAILSDMDDELATLEARRKKARQLKQGMMQELLTGRVRLV